jgi:hypothetical protein
MSATRISDSVDWEVVLHLHASPTEVAKYIAVREMKYIV